MVSVKEVESLDGLGLAELIRHGETKASDLVEIYIEKIEKLNPELNAVVTPLFDQARETATKELPEGPFTGVPFLLKDNVFLAGTRCTMGSAYGLPIIAPFDSEIAIRYKKSGLIFLGMTNLPEFGLMATTEPKANGSTLNPWDTNRSPGGSSGGSAAAVAARMAPMAHGNDGGGSIRIPASCCGLFGLKPTRARTPLPNLLACNHALTRSVRDSAALLDAIAGPTQGDAFWAPPQKRPFLEEIGQDPGKLRIAVNRESGIGTPVHKDCLRAIEYTVKLCENLDHHIEDAVPNLDMNRITQAFLIRWAAMAAAIPNQAKAIIGEAPPLELLEPATRIFLELGQAMHSGLHYNAWLTFDEASRNIAQFFDSYDVWLTPTLPQPPAFLNYFDCPPDNPMKGIARTVEYATFTGAANLSGIPAMSVPLFWNSKGLPIGTQFLAPFGDEATLFRLASQLETESPWKDRRPQKL